MAINQAAAKITKKVENDVGGTTFFVLLPLASNSKPLCYRKIHKRPGERCSNPAGFRTDHFGTGACFLHGGTNTANVTISTGRQARSMRKALEDRIERYLNEDRAKLLDLTYQLAVAKSLFDEFIEGMPGPEEEDYGVAIYRFMNILGSLSSLVERMSKTDNRNTITMAQVLYIRATVVDIFVKYLPDPIQRERAARELAKRLGGDIEVEMLASEYGK